MLAIGDTAPTAADGFLDVTSVTTWGFGANAPRALDDLIASASSYVLLGAGGAGKTVALKRLAQTDAAPYVNLAITPRDRLRPMMRAAAHAGTPVYLDAVDQFGPGESAPLAVLGQELDEAVGRGVRLRLGCRTAGWKKSFADALKAKLPDFDELNLLPLDRNTAESIVSDAGVDGRGFIDELVAARRGRLSASPQRLLAAARHWHVTGQLPHSDSAAIDFEIDEFLREHDDERDVPLSLDRARRIARRLGAIVTFTGAKMFTLGPGLPSVMGVADLPSDPEPDEPGVLLAPADYRHVLGTVLFEAAAPGVLAFRHQQYAEYLAASYLLERDIARPTLRALLGVQDNGLLPSARIGVAGWLMARDPRLVEDLAPDNAVALIQSGIEFPSEQVRAALLDGLFRQVSGDGLVVEWGLDLDVLAYPGLEAQLAARMESGAVSDVALWWVARLAIAGDCRGLSGPLAVCAKDRTRLAWARRTAVQAVARLGQPRTIESLREILPLHADEDPDRELTAALIDVLFPGQITVEELMPLLGVRPISENLIGGLWSAVRRLPERVSAVDLPALLDWLAGQPEADHGFAAPMDKLYTGLVRSAWRQTDDATVRASPANLLVSSPQSSRWLLYQHVGDPVPWGDGDGARRRALAVAVAQRAGAPSWYRIVELRLLAPDDASWLLDDLPSMHVDARAALTLCLSVLLREPTAEIADRVLSLDPAHPAFESTEPFRQTLRVDSVLNDPWHSINEHKTAADRDKAQRVDQLFEALTAALGKARTDVEAWWSAVNLLSYDENATAPAGLFTHDLTQRPGWGMLTAAERRCLLDRGIEYLTSHQPDAGAWGGQKTIESAQVLPDWCGVYLMATLLRQAPEKLEALDERTWLRWIPVIVSAWESGDASDDALRPALLKAAPHAARRAAASGALEHLARLEANQLPLSPRPVYDELAPDLAPDLIQGLSTGRYTGELAARLLDLLVQHVPSDALPLCRDLVRDATSPLSAAALEHLAVLDPDMVVDSLPSEPRPLTELVEVLTRLRMSALDDHRLETAARLLLDAFPYHEDPHPPYRSGRVEPVDEIRRVRERVLTELGQRPLPEVVARLRVGRPATDAMALAQVERSARARRADCAVVDLTPDGLLRLLKRGDHRLVRDDADLVEVVVEALDRLQHSIRHDGAFRDLWNGTDSPKSEDDISDWVRRELQQRFDRRLLIDRENQVVRLKQAGIGTRIDLAATAPTTTSPAELARVLLEAKLVGNAELETSLLQQLDRKYLVPTGLRHGIYLVYWVTPTQRPQRWTREHADVEGLRALLTAQAQESSEGSRILPYILDISRPDPPTSARGA